MRKWMIVFALGIGFGCAASATEAPPVVSRRAPWEAYCCEAAVGVEAKGCAAVTEDDLVACRQGGRVGLECRTDPQTRDRCCRARPRGPCEPVLRSARTLEAEQPPPAPYQIKHEREGQVWSPF